MAHSLIRAFPRICDYGDGCGMGVQRLRDLLLSREGPKRQMETSSHRHSENQNRPKHSVFRCFREDLEVIIVLHTSLTVTSMSVNISNKVITEKN